VRRNSSETSNATTKKIARISSSSGPRTNQITATVMEKRQREKQNDSRRRRRKMMVEDNHICEISNKDLKGPESRRYYQMYNTTLVTNPPGKDMHTSHVWSLSWLIDLPPNIHFEQSTTKRRTNEAIIPSIFTENTKIHRTGSCLPKAHL
jgi:hypothetical protein